MAEETKKTPQTPEEIAREAQAQAMKAALEQAQALYGNIPGFEGTDLMKMHEKLMQDSAEMFPGVAQAQACLLYTSTRRNVRYGADRKERIAAPSGAVILF